MGHCDSVYLTEVGDTQVVVFKHGKLPFFFLFGRFFLLFRFNGVFPFTDKEDGAISTVVIRGSTDNLMDDIERAVDDGVNTFKLLVRVSQERETFAMKTLIHFTSRSSVLNIACANSVGQATGTWSRRHRDRTGQAAHVLRRGRLHYLHAHL